MLKTILSTINKDDHRDDHNEQRNTRMRMIRVFLALDKMTIHEPQAERLNSLGCQSM